MDIGLKENFKGLIVNGCCLVLCLRLVQHSSRARNIFRSFGNGVLYYRLYTGVKVGILSKWRSPFECGLICRVFLALEQKSFI